MCASCGCGEPNEKHGDDANITRDDIEQAASAANITPQEVVGNLSSSVQ
jgi:hypothetical protein